MIRGNAEFRAHVGTDAILSLGGQPFVVPDPRLRLATTPTLRLEITEQKPTGAGVYQTRYRARPALIDGLFVFEDEARLTKQVLRLPTKLPAVVYLTLYPTEATDSRFEEDCSKQFGICPCLPDCDPHQLVASYLAHCLQRTSP